MSQLLGFHVMTKPTGPICNLDCKYCFYLEKEKLYPADTNWAMPPDVLEGFIRQHIEAHSVPEVLFAWQGGEPTILGVEYFRRVVELQKIYAGEKVIQNAFQTNGVLIDDEWCQFFTEHKFLVGISIDGPEQLHDHYRVDRGGRPTFHRVMKGLEALKRNKVDFNTLTVVNRANQEHPLEVYRFLKKIGSMVMQFIPLVERLAAHPSPLKMVLPVQDGSLAEWSVTAEGYGNFLCTIFDEWVHHDVGKHYIQLFDVSLESWMGMPASLCWFRETCGAALALEHNGDLYSCDHFVYPENKLGNIMEQPLGSLVNSAAQQKFGQDKKTTLPRMCQECDVRFACHGECPKHRFIKTPDGEDGLNYLCAGYMRFFRHIDPYMRFMVAMLRRRQAPANVMAFAPHLEAAFAASAPEAPCPCRTGGSYESCCGRTRLKQNREFADNTINFLQSKGGENADSSEPWFAVTSYVAPHDVSGWPLQWFLPQNRGVQPAPTNYDTPPPIPQVGAISNPGVPSPADGASDCPPPTSDPVPLNPGGYPAGAFTRYQH